MPSAATDFVSSLCGRFLYPLDAMLVLKKS